jgi:nucleoside-diphosphate-sugar epimerase
MSERVLVTGGTGFTGGHLCRRLALTGRRVRTLARDPRSCDGLREAGVEVVQGDLCRPNTLRTGTEGIDVVYHVAALFRPEDVSRQDLWQTNVEGTRQLLEASIQAGVRRFVHCSTVGVHGDIRQAPADEFAPYAPGDAYQESKVEAERVVLRYMREGRLPVAVFRPGGIYGPGDMRFLKLFRSIKRQFFVMLGSGNVLYQLVYIDDLVDGIVLCGSRPEAIGNTYILTGREPVMLNQLVRMIAEAVGVKPPRLRFPVTPVYLAGFLCELVFKPIGINPPLYRRRVDFFRKNRAFSISKARRELGYEPRVDLMSGLRRTAEWYATKGLI